MIPPVRRDRLTQWKENDSWWAGAPRGTDAIVSCPAANMSARGLGAWGRKARASHAEKKDGKAKKDKKTKKKRTEKKGATGPQGEDY